MEEEYARGTNNDRMADLNNINLDLDNDGNFIPNKPPSPPTCSASSEPASIIPQLSPASAESSEEPRDSALFSEAPVTRQSLINWDEDYTQQWIASHTNVRVQNTSGSIFDPITFPDHEPEMIDLTLSQGTLHRTDSPDLIPSIRTAFPRNVQKLIYSEWRVRM